MDNTSKILADDASRILAADVHQILIVLIGVLIFLYVRLACGAQARYFVHLALAYTGIGVIYFFDGAITIWSYATGTPMGNANLKATTELISSTLSLLNTAFFISTWYMMRDLRLEQKTNPQTAKPTMSNPFAASIIAALVGGIAAYLGMANYMIQSSSTTLKIFTGIDVSIAAISAWLVGSEFFRITIIRDHDEGSLFDSNLSLLIFRSLTLFLFVALGLFQFGYLFTIIQEQPMDLFKFPTGGAYYWLAALRILCAGAAAILGLHALPSERWKHKQVTSGKRSKPSDKATNRARE